mgnify:CR=1 FL=1
MNDMHGEAQSVNHGAYDSRGANEAPPQFPTAFAPADEGGFIAAAIQQERGRIAAMSNQANAAQMAGRGGGAGGKGGDKGKGKGDGGKGGDDAEPRKGKGKRKLRSSSHDEGRWIVTLSPSSQWNREALDGRRDRPRHCLSFH